MGSLTHSLVVAAAIITEPPMSLLSRQGKHTLLVVGLSRITHAHGGGTVAVVDRRGRTQDEWQMHNRRTSSFSNSLIFTANI